MSNKSTSWILDLVDQVTGPLKKIANEAKLATSLGEDLGDSFNDLGDDLKKTGDEAKISHDEVADLFSQFKTFDFSTPSKGFQSIAENIKIMTKAGLAFIATPLGAALAALAVVGLLANEFAEYNKQAREMNELTQQITQTSGQLVDQVRVRAQSLSETFDKDMKDTLQVVKNQVEAFNVTWEEAFDTVENGLIRGGKANDDYMQSLREYPKLFAQNGFALKDFQRIINEGIDRGIYDDKLPDAIKEFGLSVQEQTQTSRDALENAFGAKFTNDLFNNIKSGSITVKEALLQINDEYRKQGVNATQAQVLTADLFRGAGEDAGGFVVVMDAVNSALVEEERALTSLQERLHQTADANLRLAQAQDEALNSKAYAEFANNVSTWWNEVKILWYKGVSYVIDLFNSYVEEMAVLQAKLGVYLDLSPRIFKEAFLKIKNDVFELLGTFELFGSAVGKLIRLDFDGALEDIKTFKNAFEKEASDLDPRKIANSITGQIGAVTGMAEDMVRAGFKKDRDGAFEESKILATGNSNVMPNVPKSGPGPGHKSGPGEALKGSGSGSGKSITMNLNIVQNFSVGKMLDLEEVASTTVRMINDRLRDAVITVGS